MQRALALHMTRPFQPLRGLPQLLGDDDQTNSHDHSPDEVLAHGLDYLSGFLM